MTIGHLPNLMNNVQIKKIDNLPDLLALEQVWKELQSSECFTALGSCFEIVASHAKTLLDIEDVVFGFDAKLLILVAYEDDRPIAIAPLVNVRRKRRLGPITFNVSCIEFVSQLSERFFRFSNDIVTQNPSHELTASFLSWLYKHEKFDVVNLAHIREDSLNFPVSRSTHFLTTYDSIVDIARFTNFNSYRLVTYSRRLKNNIRTAVNRAKNDSISLTLTKESPSSVVFRDILELSRFRRHARIFREDGFYSFLVQVCQQLPSEVVVSRANDRTVGYRLYVHFKGSKHLLDTTIDRNYHRLDLGSQLSDMSIQESFREKVLTHSEGLWNSFHMRKFATQSPKLFKYVLPGNSFLGRTGAMVVALRQQAAFSHEQSPSLKLAKDSKA